MPCSLFNFVLGLYTTSQPEDKGVESSHHNITFVMAALGFLEKFKDGLICVNVGEGDGANTYIAYAHLLTHPVNTPTIFCYSWKDLLRLV